MEIYSLFLRQRLPALFATSIPKAIDKSKIPPSFLMSAGAKLTVIFLDGKSNPDFSLRLSLYRETL
ncbi:MAG: hypothetical protein Ta2C_00460 [Candidatus Endomicrobiellum trichonymphae]|nr:MAG: hypothetical protein Ta2C_00460 [Candidatus Endomicrobium trichonymphae]